MNRLVYRLLVSFTIAVISPPALWSQTVTADFDDLTKVPAAKKLLDDAAGKLKTLAQGNESSVSVKSARGKNVTFDVETKKPVAGQITVVFDLHHRHRVTPDREVVLDTPFGKIKQKIPGIVAYDRHDDVYAEYDIKQGRGRARLAKGPINLPLLPVIDWELWLNVDIKQ